MATRTYTLAGTAVAGPAVFIYTDAAGSQTANNTNSMTEVWLVGTGPINPPIGAVSASTPITSGSSHATITVTVTATAIKGSDGVVQSIATPTAISSGASNVDAACSGKLAKANSDSQGLKIAAAILGVLLGLSLLAFGIFLLLRRRSPKHTGPAPSSANVAYAADGHSSREKPAQTTITMVGDESPAGNTVDDATVNKSFRHLNDTIRDWVLNHFAGIPVGVQPSPDLAAALRRVAPSYNELLKHEDSTYQLIRAVVADIVCSAIQSREFVGQDYHSVLKRMGNSVAPADQTKWRAQTLHLLGSTPDARSILAVEERISTVLLSITPRSSESRRRAQLNQIVRMAADLSITLELAKAKYEIISENVLTTPFNTDSMEDVLQVAKSSQSSRRNVRAVIFPAVMRYGDEAETEYQRALCIYKAQVLL